MKTNCIHKTITESKYPLYFLIQVRLRGFEIEQILLGRIQSCVAEADTTPDQTETIGRSILS